MQPKVLSHTKTLDPRLSYPQPKASEFSLDQSSSKPIHSSFELCRKMLYSTSEMATQVTINSHFVFCFCNIIIILLIIDRARSNSCLSTTTANPRPLVLHNGQENCIELVECNVLEFEPIVLHPLLFNVKMNATLNDQENNVKALTSAGIEHEGHLPEEDDDDYEYDIDGGEDDDGSDTDELRRRIEEFINKVNRGWRLEKLEDKL